MVHQKDKQAVEDEQDVEDERMFRTFARGEAQRVLRNADGCGNRILDGISSSQFRIDHEDAVQLYLENEDPKIKLDIGRLVLVRAGEKHVYIDGELVPTMGPDASCVFERFDSVLGENVSAFQPRLGVIAGINSDSIYTIHSLEGKGNIYKSALYTNVDEMQPSQVACIVKRVMGKREDQDPESFLEDMIGEMESMRLFDTNARLLFPGFEEAPAILKSWIEANPVDAKFAASDIYTKKIYAVAVEQLDKDIDDMGIFSDSDDEKEDEGEPYEVQPFKRPLFDRIFKAIVKRQRPEPKFLAMKIFNSTVMYNAVLEMEYGPPFPTVDATPIFNNHGQWLERKSSDKSVPFSFLEIMRRNGQEHHLFQNIKVVTRKAVVIEGARKRKRTPVRLGCDKKQKPKESTNLFPTYLKFGPLTNKTTVSKRSMQIYNQNPCYERWTMSLENYRILYPENITARFPDCFDFKNGHPIVEEKLAVDPMPLLGVCEYKDMALYPIPNGSPYFLPRDNMEFISAVLKDTGLPKRNRNRIGAYVGLLMSAVEHGSGFSAKGARRYEQAVASWSRPRSSPFTELVDLESSNGALESLGSQPTQSYIKYELRSAPKLFLFPKRKVLAEFGYLPNASAALGSSVVYNRLSSGRLNAIWPRTAPTPDELRQFLAEFHPHLA